MSNKTEQLIEKMYTEFKSRFEQMDGRFGQIDNRFERIDKRFEQIDNRFDKMDARFDKLELKIENEISDKISGLYDDREVIKGSLAIINEKLDGLANQSANHELRLQALESGRRKKKTV